MSGIHRMGVEQLSAYCLPQIHSLHAIISRGPLDGLPVGMMMVGRPWEEATLYQLASAFEMAEDWRQR